MFTPQNRRPPQVGDDDYYGLLGLQFGASHDEIVAAYRNLARQFHPDKNTGSDEKSRLETEEQFRRFKKAYEVLSDPNQRVIYNEFGVDGLKYQNWILEKKQITTADLHEQFEKLQRKIIDNKLAIQARPYTSFTVGLDASELFAKKNEDDDDDADLKEITLYSLLPNIEISSISAAVKIDNEIALNHSLTLNGNLSAKNGMGDGAFGAGYGYQYSKHTSFLFNNLFGSKPTFSTGFNHILSDRTSVEGQGYFLIHPYGIIPGMGLTLSYLIKDNLTSKVCYKEGPNTSMRTTLIYINQRLMLEVTTSYKIGLLNHRAAIEFGYNFNEKNSRLSVAMSADTEKGLSVAYGCQTRVLDINVIGATLALNVPSGVTLKLRFVRANQEFNMPIYLSDEITSGPLFYGTMLPLIAYFVVDRCYIRFVKPKKNIFANM